VFCHLAYSPFTFSISAFRSEDPICLISIVDDELKNVSETIELEAQTPWYKTSERSSPYRENSPAYLLDECPSKTMLDLRGLSFDSQWGRTLFTGRQYLFQINLTTDIMSEDRLSQPVNTPGVYLRLVLCVSKHDRVGVVLFLLLHICPFRSSSSVSFFLNVTINRMHWLEAFAVR
jgi:hypothetical protein